MLPPVSVILGWTYLVNDEKISAIGRYVRGDHADGGKRAADAAGGQPYAAAHAAAAALAVIAGLDPHAPQVRAP